MKKALKTIMFFKLIVLILLANFAIVASATETVDNSQIPLEQRLIGTWRSELQHSWIVVFREDGTVLDGPPGFRTIYNWQVINDRLIIDGVDWNIRITDNTITVDRYGSRTFTYIWYSGSTEGETSLMLFGVIGIIIIAWIVIVAVIVIIVLIIAHKNRRKQQQILLEMLESSRPYKISIQQKM